MKSTISASHVMEYTTNDNLLTIHEKYLHSIFHIAHTSQIGKLNFYTHGVSAMTCLV